MPEENENDQDQEAADEMLRMMQEELGEEAGGDTDAGGGEGAPDAAETAEAPTEDGGADLQAEMLRAMMEGVADEDEGAPPADEAPPSGGGVLRGAVPAGSARRLADVSLSVSIELGSTAVPISSVLEWTEGSLIELDKVSGEAVDVLVNGKIYAKGEVITIAENFGVRITELLPTGGRG